MKVRNLGWSLLAAAAWLASPAALADLYWCDVPDGPAAIVQVKVEGAVCRLIAKDADSPTSTPAPAPETAAPRPPARTGSGDTEGFPLVSPQEQGMRDSMRARILEEELYRENQLLAKTREILASPRGRTFNPEDRDFYQRRMRNHFQNIKSLRQELNRLE